MRTRNREVNIFNMSLLDILTGMMGAFLFLMLGLVPYYMKSQNQKSSAAAAASSGGGQIPKTLILEVIGHWYSPTLVGIFMFGPNHDPKPGASKAHVWWSFDTFNPTLRRSGAVLNTGTSRNTGWQSVSTSIVANERYLVAFQIPVPDKAGPPTGYSRLGFTVDLLTTEATPGGKGGTSYVPVMASFLRNAAQARPGIVYAAFWITTSEDLSKPWYQQENYEITPIGPTENDLPPGVVPLPGIMDVQPENESPQAGIGVEVASDANADKIAEHLLIKGVAGGGPAAASGLQVGDEIIQVNGMSVAGRKFSEVVQNWLRGKAGSPVQVSVRRTGEQGALSFVVERTAVSLSAGH